VAAGVEPSVVNTSYPENLTNLHRGEEELRAKSIAFIEASETLSAHVAMIHSAMDLIDYFCRQHQHQTDDQLAIQLLWIRLFNASASALKLLLSGYYQTAALQERDPLETTFLLDLFTADQTLIAAWRADSADPRFRPVCVPKVLDDRDGFMERNREKAYKLLCDLAAAPNEKGFRLLTNKPGGDANCGPFFDEALLTALIEELVKLIVRGAGAFTRFFEGANKTGFSAKLAFLEAQGRWFERFYARPFDQAGMEEMRAMLAKLG
jgi:hypothetical protein